MRPDAVRPCLRCLGGGRVESGDGGALTQQRTQEPRPVICPECRGCGLIRVVLR